MAFRVGRYPRPHGTARAAAAPLRPPARRPVRRGCGRGRSRARSRGRSSSPASSSTTRRCTAIRRRPLALLNDSKQVEPRDAGGAPPGRAPRGDADLRAGDPGLRHRPQRAPPLESLGAPRRADRPRAACRGVPRRRLPARPARSAAPGGRRRRHEERGDRGSLDRREGDARPDHASSRRAPSALRLLAPRRVHHAGSLGGRA